MVELGKRVQLLLGVGRCIERRACPRMGARHLEQGASNWTAPPRERLEVSGSRLLTEKVRDVKEKKSE